MSGSDTYDNEASAVIKSGEFVTTRIAISFQEGLCFIEISVLTC
jgi:hypothetical protein